GWTPGSSRILTFSTPDERSTSAVARAERFTSSGGKPSAEMLGIFDSRTSVFLKSSKCASTYWSASFTLPLLSTMPPPGESPQSTSPPHGAPPRQSDQQSTQA